MQWCVQSNVVTSLQDVRDLKIEANSIEAHYGPNAYSTYLRTHGKRPDPDQAAGMGRLLGGQVKASDGTMRPPLSAGDRKIIKGIRNRRKAASRRYQQLGDLQNAIALLAGIEDDPVSLVGNGSCVLDAPAVVAQIDAALCYLERFAEFWHGRAHTENHDSLGGCHKRDGT